jgi:hypothetical protein
MLKLQISDWQVVVILPNFYSFNVVLDALVQLWKSQDIKNPAGNPTG